MHKFFLQSINLASLPQLNTSCQKCSTVHLWHSLGGTGGGRVALAQHPSRTELVDLWRSMGERLTSSNNWFCHYYHWGLKSLKQYQSRLDRHIYETICLCKWTDGQEGTQTCPPGSTIFPEFVKEEEWSKKGGVKEKKVCHFSLHTSALLPFLFLHPGNRKKLEQLSKCKRGEAAFGSPP